MRTIRVLVGLLILTLGVPMAGADVVDVSSQTVLEPVYVYGPGLVRLTGRTVVGHLAGGDSSLAYNRLPFTESAACSCYVTADTMADGSAIKTGRYEIWTTNGVDTLRWETLWIQGRTAGTFTVGDSSMATAAVGSRAIGAEAVGTSELADKGIGADDYGDLSIPNRAIALGAVYSENLETNVDVAGRLTSDSLSADDPVFVNYIKTPVVLPYTGGTSTPTPIWGHVILAPNATIRGDTLWVRPSSGSIGGTLVLDDIPGGSGYQFAVTVDGLTEDILWKVTAGEGTDGDVWTYSGGYVGWATRKWEWEGQRQWTDDLAGSQIFTDIPGLDAPNCVTVGTDDCWAVQITPVEFAGSERRFSGYVSHDTLTVNISSSTTVNWWLHIRIREAD